MKPEAMLATSIKNAAIAYAKRATKAKATTVPCQYVGKDGEGKMWVLLPGATSPTPVRRASVEAAPGDTVSVTIGNGRAVIDSNISNPSAGTSSVARVEGKADTAQETADAASAYAKDAYDAAARAGESASVAQSKADEAARGASVAQAKADEATGYAQEAQGQAGIAKEAADAAQESADTAYEAAQEAISDAADAASAASAAQSSADSAASAADAAQGSADEAKQSATVANTYANSALDQLGIVQDVVGVLDWASKHGTFAKTTDTEIVDGKVYFTFDGTDYAPVVDPQASQLSDYYELSMTEAMNDFILAHLAVTQRGLWILPSGMGSASDAQYAPKYKLLLANDGMYLYDGTGAQVVKYGSEVRFSDDRMFVMGDESGDSYIAFVPGSGVVIGGNVTMGGNMPLSQLAGVRYDSTWAKANGTYSFTGYAYKGGMDVSADYPPEFFVWYLRNESGESLLGRGRTCSVAQSLAGYHGTVVGGLEDSLDCYLVDDSGNRLVTEDGAFLADLIWEV